MSALLLGLFVVSALFWVRLPERVLGVLTAGATVLCALAVVLLGSLPRAQAAGVAAGLLLGGGLLSPGLSLPRLRLRLPSAQRRRPAGVPAPLARTTTEVQLRDYEVLQRIGVGGMGNVYRARRVADGRVVALKVPQEKYLADAKFVKRFYREAEVLRRLAHPGIVKVIDYKAEADEHYIAMEYLEGETLEHILETRPLTFGESVQIVRAVAEALAHIHAQNIVHRDLKPANIMVLRGAFKEGRLREGGVKLMDFGIAVGKVLTRLTMTGARVGTPIYMAPEQAKGQRVDARSDVYSLGLLFYEMVTGETPFKGSYEAVVHQQVFEPPRPPKQLRLDVPGQLSDLILRLIEKDPAQRPTLDELLARLNADLLRDDQFDDPQALALSVGERQGTLRLLDLGGRLRQSLRDLGGDAGLSAAPSALGADEAGHLYAAVVAYRSGGAPSHLIRKLGAGGQDLLGLGRYGLGEGELLQPVSLCAAGERLYVLDAETCLVSMYLTSGEYLGRFGGRGTGKGSFEKPVTVAAGSEGSVYVLDVAGREVQRFSRDGRYLSRLAFKLDRTSDALRPLDGLATDRRGAVYIGDVQASKIRRIDPGGQAGGAFTIEPLQEEATDTPWMIAVDEEGTLYCVRQGGQLLRKFSAQGKLLATTETYSPVLAMTMLQREVARHQRPVVSSQ